MFRLIELMRRWSFCLAILPITSHLGGGQRTHRTWNESGRLRSVGCAPRNYNVTDQWPPCIFVADLTDLTTRCIHRKALNTKYIKTRTVPGFGIREVEFDHLKQRLIEEWSHFEQRIIDWAVHQWRVRLFEQNEATLSTNCNQHCAVWLSHVGKLSFFVSVGLYNLLYLRN